MRIRLDHQRLARELARSAVTLNRWAQRMGLRSGHLSQLANGKRPYPTARTRKKLLDALDLDFDELFIVEQPREDRVTSRQPPARFSDAGSPVPRPRMRKGRKDSVMSGTLFDLRLAWRSLSRRPTYALSAVLTLAIGIGANIALFGVANSVLFKAYPFESPERLFSVHTTHLARDGALGNFSWLDYLDFNERLDGVMEMAVYDWEPFSIAGGDRPQRVGAGQVTSNFAEVIGVDMLRGRFFTEEERRSDQQVLVIGEGLWRSTFGADKAIVGRSVIVDGEASTVVGVAPESLDAIEGAQIFVPLRPSDAPESRISHWLDGFARLEDGVSPEVARQRLSVVAAELAVEYPDENDQRGATMIDLRSDRIGPIGSSLWALLGVVGVVLLIACVNVANLSLARGVTRAGEIGLRMALGADRVRLARQLLAESSIVAVLGLSLGLLVAALGTRALWLLLPVERIPEWVDPTWDLRVLSFAVVLTVLSVFIFGLIPALRHSRNIGTDTTRFEQAHGMRPGRMRGALVVAEVALAVILVFGASVLIRGLVRLADTNPGFEARNAMVFGLDLLSLRNSEPEIRQQRFERYLQKLSAIPGVSAVGATDRIPLGGGANTRDLTAETPDVRDYVPTALFNRVTPGFMEAMGIPLLVGSDFDFVSARSSERYDAVISESFAERLWPDGNPIGQRLKFGSPEDDAPWYSVIGVVGDVRHFGLDRAPMPTVYATRGSLAMSRAQWVMRSEIPPSAAAAAVRMTVEEVDANQPLWGVRSLEDHVGLAMWMERFVTTLFWFFASVAMLLAAVGVYGVLAFAVSTRRREIGVRLALGSTPGEVARLVVGQGLRLLTMGIAIGLPAGFLLARAIRGLFAGLEPMDPIVTGATVLLLLVVGLVAALAPAWRASAVDPAFVLRSD